MHEGKAVIPRLKSALPGWSEQDVVPLNPLSWRGERPIY